MLSVEIETHIPQTVCASTSLSWSNFPPSKLEALGMVIRVYSIMDCLAPPSPPLVRDWRGFGERESVCAFRILHIQKKVSRQKINIAITSDSCLFHELCVFHCIVITNKSFQNFYILSTYYILN